MSSSPSSTPPSDSSGLSPAEHLRRSREAGRALVAAWESSGMSMRAYARQQGIRERKLGYWRQRVHRQERPAEGASAAFIEIIRTPSGVPGGGVTIELAHGTRLRVEPGFDVGLLRSVMAALSGSSEVSRC